MINNSSAFGNGDCSLLWNLPSLFCYAGYQTKNGRKHQQKEERVKYDEKLGALSGTSPAHQRDQDSDRDDRRTKARALKLYFKFLLL